MTKNRKLPPFGKALAERLAFLNLPEKVIICAGGQIAWQTAKSWNARPNYSALVLPPELNPESVHWPVANCLCQIEWQICVPMPTIKKLAEVLHKDGADKIIVWPQWINPEQASHAYDFEQQAWQQVRETVKILYGEDPK